MLRETECTPFQVSDHISPAVRWTTAMPGTPQHELVSPSSGPPTVPSSMKDNTSSHDFVVSHSLVRDLQLLPKFAWKIPATWGPIFSQALLRGHTAAEAEVSLIWVSNQNLSRGWIFRANATRKCIFQNVLQREPHYRYPEITLVLVKTWPRINFMVILY